MLFRWSYSNITKKQIAETEYTLHGDFTVNILQLLAWDVWNFPFVKLLLKPVMYCMAMAVAL